MKPIRLGVVGAGHLGRIHARIASSLPAFELLGIADPLAPARDETAARHQIAAHADHRELLDHVDAAIIATPTQLHRAVALDFLSRGIHVLVEKPLAPTGVEAQELVSAARQSGCVLQVGHVERFNPLLALVAPRLGTPYQISCLRQGSFTFRSTDIGVVLDLMIHDIDLVLSIVRSPVVKIEAIGAALLGQHEDTAQAHLTFDSGCVATLTASRVAPIAARTMQVWSPTALATLDLATRTGTLVCPSLAVQRGEFDVERLDAAGRERLKQSLTTDHLPVQQLAAEPVDAITAELDDFANSIRTGRAPRVGGEQGALAVEVAEEIVSCIARSARHVVPLERRETLAPAVPAPHFVGRSWHVSSRRREAG